MDLQIRHSTSLLLRNDLWNVTIQSVSETILGRPVLEALGLNTSDIFTAAINGMNCSLDLKHLRTAGEGGCIAQVYEGLYCSDQGADGDEPEKEQWLYPREDMDEDYKEALPKSLKNAWKNGISNEGQSEIAHLIWELKEVIRLRLSNQEPAKVKPSEIHFKPNSILIRTCQRKCSQGKLQFIKKYVDILLTLAFFVLTRDLECVDAPNVVSKKPLTLFLRPVNHSPN